MSTPYSPAGIGSLTVSPALFPGVPTDSRDTKEGDSAKWGN